jgi:AcrR family transcriptional regulator
MPGKAKQQPPMRERILQAAVEVFRERGVTKATTKEIARAAGVSEGSLYNHFENKSALFGATFGTVASGVAQVMRELMESVGENTVEENLVRFVAAETEFYAELLPIVGPVLADRELLDWLQGDRPERSRGPLLGHAGLMGYLDAERDAGRLAPGARTAAIAAALLGACQHHAFTTRFAGAKAVEEIGRMHADAEAFARELVPAILESQLPPG